MTCPKSPSRAVAEEGLEQVSGSAPLGRAWLRRLGRVGRAAGLRLPLVLRIGSWSVKRFAVPPRGEVALSLHLLIRPLMSVSVDACMCVLCSDC